MRKSGEFGRWWIGGLVGRSATRRRKEQEEDRARKRAGTPALAQTLAEASAAAFLLITDGLCYGKPPKIRVMPRIHSYLCLALEGAGV